jgi:hypothetical protein
MTNTHKYDFLNRLDLSDDVKLRLSLLLSRTESGSDEVYMTPLGKNNDPEQILSEWDQIYKANMQDINEPLDELEKSNRSKFGPRSIAIPWEERRELVTVYFGESTYDPDTVVGPAAIRRLRPLTPANAVHFLKNNTNSGLPYYVSKGKVKEDVLDNFEEILNRRDPCVLFTRTQESRKTRAVWGFPIADTLNEMRYYRPVLDYQRTLEWRSAIVHPDEVDKQVTKLIDHALANDESLISIDFSLYDATLREGHQKAAFEYIKLLFQEQYGPEIDYISDRFGTIGLVTPDGVMEGKHGVPSGSTFTNEVDSICQYQMAMDIDPDIKHFQIQGDDGCYSHPSPETLMEGFEARGMKVNKEKSHIASNWLTYLQLLYHDDYRDIHGLIGGIYPVYRALNRLVYQERFDDFKDYGIEGRDFYAIRTLSILENCRNHPLFEIFVKFILSKDKYGLEPSQEGVEKYVKMLRDKVGIEGIFSHQYGTDVTGIKALKPMI